MWALEVKLQRKLNNTVTLFLGGETKDIVGLLASRIEVQHRVVRSVAEGPALPKTLPRETVNRMSIESSAQVKFEELANRLGTLSSDAPRV